ncbi:MAG: lipid-A-disaccharide synthase [Desulfotignum sp.]|nr:lipid-A-disaccharide synthase [Desulfotignum sp.]MCF8136833.1 lipid-A-disaccharide synthase [Desulfotignum sp.]
MKDPGRHVLILAGEPSGDVHGAGLITAMRQQDPSLTFHGIGGTCMAKAGAHLFFSIDELSAMGLLEVIRQIRPVKQAFDLFKHHLRTLDPELVILVDYPGFNLRAAAYARTHSQANVFYYIPPKVWAWNSARLKQMASTVDHAALIFPFEEKIYKKAGIPATYVGNPLLDQYPVPLKKSVKSHSDSSKQRIIGLLPGSRKNEIHTLLTPMLTAAVKIHGNRPHVRFLVSAADAIPLDMIESKVAVTGNPELFQIISGTPRQIFERADMLIAASGTITLEAALCTIPTVIVYKMSYLTFRMAQAVVKVKYAGLANIIMDNEVMPELLQDEVTPENISSAVLYMLDHLNKYRQKLVPVRQLLGGPGAAGRAAGIALGLKNRPKNR